MNNTLNNTSSNFSEEGCSLPVAHGLSLITTNALVGLLGTFGNLMVCAAVATTPRLRRPLNYLLFSLAIADLIVTMVCEPLLVAILSKITFLDECDAIANLERPTRALSRFSCFASVAHIAAISVDRFISVVYPLRYKSIMPNGGLKIMLIATWAFPVTVIVLTAAIPGRLPKALLAVVAFALMYAIIIVSYLLIVAFLIKHRKRRNQLRVNSSREVNRSRVEIRAAFTLAIVIGVFTACWFPLWIALFPTGRRAAHMWIRTLAFSNSTMNFLIYTLRMPDFRKAYCEILRNMCSRRENKNRTNPVQVLPG
ncbi:melanocyte-stimulating hormone receptor-like [Oculina patagonica]